MLFRRGGEKPIIKQLKEIECAQADLAGVVAAQALKGWHIADGRYGTTDIRDKFRKSHATNVSEIGGSGGQKTVTPTGSANNHTLTSSETPSHYHQTVKDRGTTYTAGGTASIPVDSQSIYSRGCSYAAGSLYYGLQKSGAHDANVGRSSNVGSGSAHNHSLTLDSQDNEPQHIIVLVLQYTGQKIAGVTP